MKKLLILTMLLLTGCSNNTKELFQKTNESSSKCVSFDYENDRYVLCTEKEFKKRQL